MGPLEPGQRAPGAWDEDVLRLTENLYVIPGNQTLGSLNLSNNVVCLKGGGGVESVRDPMRYTPTFGERAGQSRSLKPPARGCLFCSSGGVPEMGIVSASACNWDGGSLILQGWGSHKDLP